MNHWTHSELDRDRRQAIEDFVQERLREPLERYSAHLDAAFETVDDLFQRTHDLTHLQTLTERLREELLEIVTDDSQRYAFRYLAGPPISDDDLKTLAGTTNISRRKLTEQPEMIDDIARLVITAYDRKRFPWISESRSPTDQERHAAILATAALIAYQRTSTDRRRSSRTDQEDQVAELLRDAGMTEEPARIVKVVQHAPSPGSFCRESLLGDQKADLLITLWDGRVMPVECKVSNSSVNSYKRLNREAQGKAGAWLRDFGRAQVVPAVVLGGVFAMNSLTQAQDAGVSIFWAHRLDALKQFVEKSKS